MKTDLLHKLYPFLPHRIVKAMLTPADFRLAKRKLLSSKALSVEEKVLLDKVSLRIHYNDLMYVPYNAQHYLLVGLSAIRCIEDALNKSLQRYGANTILSILDFPCGHGRVLRFLQPRFPNADITACEIDRAALNFCKREFSVKPVISDVDFKKLFLSDKFDLIWCGSLITHIDEDATTSLLRFFHQHLSPRGLCVFTTHGQYSVEHIQKGLTTYGLTALSKEKLLSGFYEKGYGYADYENHPGYGISVISHDHMLKIARRVGNWDEVCYVDHGWDNHQDVYAFGYSNTEQATAANIPYVKPLR